MIHQVVGQFLEILKKALDRPCTMKEINDDTLFIIHELSSDSWVSDKRFSIEPLVRSVNLSKASALLERPGESVLNALSTHRVSALKMESAVKKVKRLMHEDHPKFTPVLFFNHEFINSDDYNDERGDYGMAYFSYFMAFTHKDCPDKLMALTLLDKPSYLDGKTKPTINVQDFDLMIIDSNGVGLKEIAARYASYIGKVISESPHSDMNYNRLWDELSANTFIDINLVAQKLTPKTTCHQLMLTLLAMNDRNQTTENIAKLIDLNESVKKLYIEVDEKNIINSQLTVILQDDSIRTSKLAQCVTQGVLSDYFNIGDLSLHIAHTFNRTGQRNFVYEHISKDAQYTSLKSHLL